MSLRIVTVYEVGVNCNDFVLLSINYEDNYSMPFKFSMIQFLRKVSDSELQQKEQLIQKINCSECDSFQLYQAAGL